VSNTTKRAITVEDVAAFELVSNPILSPDGQWVVYESTTASLKEDEYATQLRMVRADGTGLRTLTSQGSRNHQAAFSPDGRSLAFVSNRAYGTQLWVLPLDGGEARQVTRLRHGMGAPFWSPDGKTLYGTAGVARDGQLAHLDAELSEKEVRELLEKERSDWQNGPKRYDWLNYKEDGDGLSRGRVSQLVAVDVATGEAQQRTFGVYGVASPCVSPDGRYLAFVSNRREHHETVSASDVYRLPAAGGEPECLTQDIIAEAVAFSPDGRELAMFGHHDEFANATHNHVYTMAAEGGPLADWTPGFPDDIGGDGTGADMRGAVRGLAPVWGPDGHTVYALSAHDGRSEVVRFARPQTGEGTEATVLAGGERDIFRFATDGTTTLVLAYALPTVPGRIVATALADAVAESRPRHGHALSDPAAHDGDRSSPVGSHPSHEVRLDDSNQALLDELDLVEPETFWYQAADGWSIEGWVMRPRTLGATGKAPVVLEIHGGPHTHYGYAMFHEMQLLAARGFGVVYVNPRGSTSYGQTFVDAVRMHYGERDASDILSGLDAALERFAFLDGERVAVTGGSYGGFMTNWLVGHTNRFFAAVTQRSISNWISFYGVSDIGPRFTEMQLGGDVVHDMERLWAFSPLAYVANVQTPLLMIHSEEDHRCPIEQAEQFYRTLKRMEREVELLRVPNASHDLSRSGKPKLRVARLEGILGWIESHLPADQGV
jgi:dipeptidyl aminopeptidase/acylaminoacyl peptidase